MTGTTSPPSPVSAAPRRGFTIGELAVVLVIIGILSAISIPVFLNQRARSQDAQAISTLRNVVTVLREHASVEEEGHFPGAFSSDIADLLADLEASYHYTIGASGGPDHVSVFRASSQLVSYAALSNSGTCWFIRDDLHSGFELFSHHDIPELVDLAADSECGAPVLLGLPVPDPDAEPPSAEMVLSEELLEAYCPASCFYSSAWGDPHLVTWDGLGYEFQTIGEYLTARSLPGLGEGFPAVEVHLRAENPGLDTTGRVSYTTGVAAQVGDHRVSLLAGGSLRVDGEAVDVPDGGIYVLGEGLGSPNLHLGYIARFDDSYPQYRLAWPGDPANLWAARPLLDVWDIGPHLNVNGFLPDDYAAFMEGLWGNADGGTATVSGDVTSGPYDDLMTGSDPTDFLSIPASNHSIHTTVADAWALSQGDSLFDANGHGFVARNAGHPDGYPSRYMNPVPTKPFAGFDTAAVSAAIASCASTPGVPANLVEACAFDMLIAGDANPVARNAAKYGATKAHQPLLVNAYDDWDEILTFSGLTDTGDIDQTYLNANMSGWLRESNGSGVSAAVRGETLRIEDAAGRVSSPTSAQERYRRIRRNDVVADDFTLQSDVYVPGLLEFTDAGHTSTSFGLLLSDGDNMWWVRVSPTAVSDGNAPIDDPSNIYFTNLSDRYAQLRIAKSGDTASLYVDGEFAFELTPASGASFGNTVMVGMISSAYSSSVGWGVGAAHFDNIAFAAEDKGDLNMSLWSPASGWHHSLFFSDDQLPTAHGWVELGSSNRSGVNFSFSDHKLVLTDSTTGTSAQERWRRWTLPNSVPENLTLQLDVRASGGASGQSNTSYGVALADGTNMWWVRFMPTSVSDGNLAPGTPGSTFATNLHSREAQVRLVKRGTDVTVWVDGEHVFDLTPVAAGPQPIIPGNGQHFGNSISFGFIRTYDEDYAPDNYNASRITTGTGEVTFDNLRISAQALDGAGTDTWSYNTLFHTWSFDDGARPEAHKGWLWSGNGSPSVTFEDGALTVSDTVDGSSSSSTYARWRLPHTVTSDFVAQATVRVPGAATGSHLLSGHSSNAYGLLVSDGTDMWWLRVMPTSVSDGNVPVGTPDKTFSTNLRTRSAQIRIAKSALGASAYVDGEFAFDLTPLPADTWGNQVAFGAIWSTQASHGYGTAKVMFYDVSLGAKPASGIGMDFWMPNPWLYETDFSDGLLPNQKAWNTLFAGSSSGFPSIEGSSLAITDTSTTSSNSSAYLNYRMPYTVTHDFLAEAVVQVPGLDGTGVHNSSSFGLLLSDGTDMWWVRFFQDRLEDGNNAANTHAVDLAASPATIRLSKSGSTVSVSVDGSSVMTLTPAAAGAWGNTVALGQIASKESSAAGYGGGRIWVSELRLGR